MNSRPSRSHQFIGFLVVIASAVPGSAVAQQTPSAADGPWSGQEQCALSTRAANYQDDQIQMWRITGGPPVIAGSVRNWPGVWSVRGTGSRANPPEHWTVDVPERSVPISMSDVPVSGRLHIASTHAQLVASGAVQVTGSTAQTILTSGSVYEWQMPTVEDAGTATTISGSRTRTLTTGYSWQRPLDAVTTETCTWNFTRVAASSQSGATATLAPTVSAGTSSAVTATAAPQTTGLGAQAGSLQQVDLASISPTTASTGTATGNLAAGSTTTTLAPLSGGVAVNRAASPWSRTITLGAFTGAGTFAPVAPRSITLTGFTGTGVFVPVPPRTVTITGWTGIGP